MVKSHQKLFPPDQASEQKFPSQAPPIFAREPQAKPRRLRVARSRAEKLPLHFLFLRVPIFKFLKEKAIFLRGSAVLRHCGGADSFVQFPLEKGSRKVYNYSTKIKLSENFAVFSAAICKNRQGFCGVARALRADRTRFDPKISLTSGFFFYTIRKVK
ncbi:MAG: hypothetical protein CO139_00420 [Candidatus Moranbacteria bacterium CG_4_9_14_3_um_filter_36_9]|nr:MAG: hypothetical protein CO139_00420 [Candidatus Moranbacteria bacterium CG_4_9_14_3_um_filter_36_9]